MVPWSVMSYSKGARSVSDPDKPLHPDDEEALRNFAKIRHTLPNVDFDLTEAGLKKLSDFVDEHFQDEQINHRRRSAG